MEDIFFENLELVIFDVDGTLYRQATLRKIMLFKLFFYYIFRPWRYKEVFILYNFRKEREKRTGYRGVDLEEEQYLWCAERMNINVNKVKEVISKWIFQAPNRHLKTCVYPGVMEFLLALRSRGIQTAVYSDYNSRVKLNHMCIEVNLEVSSTDKHINSFKPNTDGLAYILKALHVSNVANCLYIGDRYELDGLCAKALGIQFLLINDKTASENLYHKLADKLNNIMQKKD